MNKTLRDKDLGKTSGRRDLSDVRKHRRQLRKKIDQDDSENEVETDGKLRGYRDGRSTFNWGLMKNFFVSRIGRPWSDVFSEFCQEISDPDSRSTVIDHIVETSAIKTEDGSLATTGYYGREVRPLTEQSHLLYVDESGILRRTPRRPRYRHTPEINGLMDDGDLIIQKDGLFYRVPADRLLTSAHEKIPAALTIRIEDGPGFRNRRQVHFYADDKKQLSGKAVKNLREKYGALLDEIENYDFLNRF